MKTIKELQQELKVFEQHSWDAPKDEAGYLRHTILHLGKLLGKASTVAERREHNLDPDLSQLKTEVIPDLLYYALALSNVYNIDLENAFMSRLDSNQKRVKEWVDQREIH